MKAEIKIPVFGLILAGLLITSIIVVLSVLYFHAKEVKKIEAKYEEYKSYTIEQINQKSDSINVLNGIISKLKIREDSSKMELTSLREKLNSKLIKLENRSSIEAYKETLTWLSDPIDSSEFIYSGNQVKEIQKEHLEKINSIEINEVYARYAITLNESINSLEEKCKKTEEIAYMKDSMRIKEMSMINESLTVQKKKNNRLKIVIPTTGALGIIMGVLIAL
ncbi:hypothetical protein JW865_09430 [Candidatus Bathyarchaeota archaeon]|nr:hypothetical protein [Candidatus Bathyarchaeota archaeon]